MFSDSCVNLLMLICLVLYFSKTLAVTSQGYIVIVSAVMGVYANMQMPKNEAVNVALWVM